MKRVGVREFRDHATKYLAGDEVLTIERHGKEIGVYIPTKASSNHIVRHEPVDPQRMERVQEALKRLDEAVQQVLDRTGMTEDELADLFDWKKPLPDESIVRPTKELASTHATRH